MKRMRCMLLLVALVAGVRGYVQLVEVDYKQLQDRNGMLTLNASTYNRVAFDDGANTLYVLAREPARLTAFSVAFDGHLTEFSNINLTSTNDGDPQHVEFCRPTNPANTPRLAISYNAPSNPGDFGRVRLYNALSQANPNLEELQDFTVGANPVDMEFAMDCLRLVVVNQARPSSILSSITDLPGTVDKVDLPGVLPGSITITSIGFDNLLTAGNIPILDAKNFRRTPILDNNGNIIPIVNNMEPVSITVAPNGQTAYVAMPKNNAIARIQLLDTSRVDEIIPMGRRYWANFYMDASKSDNAVHMENYRIYSTLQPRQVKWVTQDQAEWLITLDSGFIDEIPEYNYRDWDTGSNLMSSGMITGADSQLQDKLNDPKRLGEAYVSKVDGLDVTGSTIKDVYMFGGRGISIHDGQTLDVRTSLVDNVERVSAQFYKEVHNTDFVSPINTPQTDRDSTSPTMGPNLAVLETGLFNNKKLLFMGSGSSGMIYVYVLVAGADCPQPFFHSVYRRGGISATWETLYTNGDIGDLGITDMMYIGSSADHEKLLVVVSAISNSVSVYKVQDNPVELRK